MGRLGLKCTISCPPSHPGHLKPFAAEELSKAWLNLDQAEKLIVRLSNISGGDTEAEMKLDIRFREGTVDEILSNFPENIKVELLEKTLPYFAEKNTKLTRAFLRAIREMDGTPVFKKKTGTSDMNVLGEKWKDAPMLAYGPGDGRLGHTDDEQLEVDEFLKGVEVLERALGLIFNL
jgi:LysW-gamma-L-lysine carboxypeptidase